MYSIELMDNKSEIIAYNVPDMPVKSCFSRQADFPMLSIANHWHSDFEFLYILKGKINYCVDGEKCTASEGQMIFVNSARLHYGTTPSRVGHNSVGIGCDPICLTKK